MPITRQLLSAIVTCLAILCFAATGHAQSVIQWTNSGGGFWHSGSNWSGGLPPTPGETAIFNLPNTYNVLWNDGFGDSVNAQLVVGAGNVTFSNTSSSTRTHSVLGNTVITGIGTRLTVGSFPGNIMQLTSGGLVVNSGGEIVATAGSRINTSGLLTLGTSGSGTMTVQAGGIVTANNSTLGESVGSTGIATITGSGSQWSITGTGSEDFIVGKSGTGTLNVNNGGVVESPYATPQIGLESGSSGHVTVNNGFWDSNDLHVGVAGTGTLNVENGGFVRNTNVALAIQPGSSGTATISGSSSLWDINTDLEVGHAGVGTLNIENGAALHSGFAGSTIGRLTGSSGVVTVTGNGSSWGNLFDLFVGKMGTGTLNVENGGAVVSSSQGTTKSYIGFDSNSSGTVTVTGIGSKWNVYNQLNVGNEGSGTLNVAAGGVVKVHDSIIGLGILSHGGATVTGSGSRWEIGSELTVGGQGEGTLIVLAGGLVTSSQGYIGGSSGLASVVGSSRWNNSGLLSVGHSGQGSLHALEGGVVTSLDGFIGYGTGTIGEAAITGVGSQWNNSGGLHVGRLGTGRLNVYSGGVVNNTTGFIGDGSGSTGIVTVNGSGSQWNNSQNLLVGNQGVGYLNLEDGAVVANYSGLIGFGSGSSGLVNVSGSGAQWNNGGDLYVGWYGDGTLNVTAGGLVNDTNGFVGYENGSSGVANVIGNGSRWYNSGALRVGYLGTGTLYVATGGVVTNSDAAFIGNSSGAAGSVTVTGIGSQWNNSGSLTVGSSVASTLTVSAGGVVTSGAGNYIADQAADTGIVTVTGSGSRWINSGDLRVGSQGNGTLRIESGGIVNSGSGISFIGYASGSTGAVTVTGNGSQWNQSGDLRVGLQGNGTLNIADGGKVSVSNLTTIGADGYVFNSNGSLISNTVINQSGGLIYGQGQYSANASWDNFGLMIFSAGLSDVYGGFNNLAGGSIVLEDAATVVFHNDVTHNGSDIALGDGSNFSFLGAVSGLGNFVGGGTVLVTGHLAPGNSPGSMSFGGNLGFTEGASLLIELGGLGASEFDQLFVQGDLSLNGSELDVSLWNGFTLSKGMQFLIADVEGGLFGQFNGLGEGSLVGHFGGTDLFITYNGFGGNAGVGLFTSAVPEPAALSLAGLAMVALAGSRRRRVRCAGEKRAVGTNGSEVERKR